MTSINKIPPNCKYRTHKITQNYAVNELIIKHGIAVKMNKLYIVLRCKLVHYIYIINNEINVSIILIYLVLLFRVKKKLNK